MDLTTAIARVIGILFVVFVLILNGSLWFGSIRLGWPKLRQRIAWTAFTIFWAAFVLTMTWNFNYRKIAQYGAQYEEAKAAQTLLRAGYQLRGPVCEESTNE